MYTMHEQKKPFDILFVSLCLFALLRQILNIKIVANFSIAGFNGLELFSIGISYLLSIVTIYNIFRERTFRLDLANFFALMFCFYLLMTILIGSSLREVLRLILPIFIFFAVRSVVYERKQIVTLLSLSVISYIIPIIGSFLLILKGESIGKTIYQTGLIRYEGMYLKIHTFAHAMLIFVVLILLLYELVEKEAIKKHKYIFVSVGFLLIMALFNLFKSYTRNTWIGTLMVLSFLLVGKRKFKLLSIAFLSLVTIAIFSQKVHTYFFDFIEPLEGEKELRDLGAGRFGMWTELIHNFKELPIELKFVGVGIGQRNKGFEISRGHNDFFSLLYTEGITGLFLYLLLLMRIAYDILRSRLESPKKLLFLGYLLAVIFMNMASNSYLSRIECGQYFYMVIGFFYVFNDKLQDGIKI